MGVWSLGAAYDGRVAEGPVVPTYIGLAATFSNVTSNTYTVTQPNTTIFLSINSVNIASASAAIDGVAMTAIGNRYGTNAYNSSFGWFFAMTGLGVGSKTITISHNGAYVYGVAVAYKNITTLGTPFYVTERNTNFTVPGSTVGKLVIGSLNTNDTSSGFTGGTQRERQVGQTIFEATGSAANLSFSATCDGGSQALGWAAAAVS